MMDTRSQERFDAITALDPKEIAKDKDALNFLRARRTYLRPEQKAIFADLLKGLDEMTPEEKKQFDEANKKAELEAKKAEEEKAIATKTIKESQNPEEAEALKKAKK